MAGTVSRDITELLQAWGAGDRQALDDLFPLVYDELHRIARAQFAREPAGHTLQPTAVVSELYVELVACRRLRWVDRSHFFGFAAQQMRRILVAWARRRKAAKRGGSARDLSLDELPFLADLPDEELLRLDDALTELERFNPEGCRLVIWRFFGGLNHEEIARLLGVSRTTARNKWRAAKLWLRRELEGGADPGSAEAAGGGLRS